MTEETKVGGLSGTIPEFVTQVQYDRFETVLAQWQAVANLDHYHIRKYTQPADQVHGRFGSKYARLDIGGSGAYLVRDRFRYGRFENNPDGSLRQQIVKR